MHDVLFEKVIPTTEQIDELFQLLNGRTHQISHKHDVSYDRHKEFVSTNPYRDWFLLRMGGELIGSVYITTENTVGVNINSPVDDRIVSTIVEFVKSNFEPLEAIPSVRSAAFAINVPPTNKHLIDSLTSLGSELAQLTFYLPK